MSSGDDHRMDADADEQELQRNCKEVSALSEIPNLAISDPAGDSLNNEKNLSPITPEMVQALYSEDVAIQLEAAQQFRKLLWDKPSPPTIDQVINSSTVPRFVAFLNDTRYPELQFESAWVLTNIASGTSAQTQVVIDAGAVPVLSMLLSSPNENVLEQSIWALGNIAGDNSIHTQVVIQSGAVPLLIRLISSSNKSVVEQTVWALSNITRISTEYRDLILNSNILPPLLGLFNDNASTSMMRIATWTLRTLCRCKNSSPNFKKVSQCLPLLAHLMELEDTKVLANVCWALSNLSEGSSEQIQVVIDSGVCPRAVQLLSHSSNRVVSGALCLVGTIAMVTDAQTQVIINENAVPALGRLLSHKEEYIVKDACWALSNITAGNEQQVQAVIDAKLLPSLVELLHHGAISVRKEAAWAIHNATENGSDEQIACLVDAGAIEPFCQLLTETDSDLIQEVLIVLERILSTGESFAKQAGSTVNPYATYVKKFEGLEKMTLLSSHNDLKIKEKASTIIEMYLSTALVK